MNNSSFFKSFLLTLGILTLTFFTTTKQGFISPFKSPLFIAHASGGIDGRTYLNSLEALNYNYQLGHRYFEVDFSWTSDNQLVLIHDWKQSYKRLFNNYSELAPTLAEFLQMDMAFNQTQLSLDQFADWMIEHPEAIVIADIKSNNLKGLKLLLKTINNPYERIIPQLYQVKNYYEIRKLGFKEKHIMYAMYKTMKLNDEILSFIYQRHLFGISIQPAKDYFETVLAHIGQSKTPIYTLTVNDLELLNKYQSIGVDGTVTDFLYQNNDKILIQKQH